MTLPQLFKAESMLHYLNGKVNRKRHFYTDNRSTNCRIDTDGKKIHGSMNRVKL